MVTFCDKQQTETRKPIIIESGIGATKVGIIHLIPVWHGWQNGRMWIWFPLVMEAEAFGKTLGAEWLKVYPRVIQFSDGKYYTFRGTHSAIPEYRIKGDNTVYYREILVENGERIEYI
jgi:hypothetical protein